MTLAELRKLAIRKQMRISFPLETGEATIDERGIARVPGLRTVPGYNLEQVVSGVTRFRLETLAADGKPRPAQVATPEQVTQLLASLSPSSAAAAPADHDE